MSAAVWNEPHLPERGRRDESRVPGGAGLSAWDTVTGGVALSAVPAPRRPVGDRLPRTGRPAPAETA